MGRINVLDSEVAQLIAAGEVVERPGSVVKELVENSIDAGATAVRVELKHGGNTFIRISDNGCGIARDDCPTAFMPHATSKVKNADDLDGIATLGFRGEALASVATVSKVELISKTAEEECGTRLVIHGGEIMELEDTGCPVGTVITVSDLFYNTPARLKFMKKDVAEGNYIAQIIDRLALSHPDISFRFSRETGEQLHTPGDGKLISAIYAVCGAEFAKNLIEVEYKIGGFEVSGYICPPTETRKNRNMQIFFLNGRYIKSNTFAVALEQAYKDSIMQGRFPACVLNVKMPLNAVDVNVHPAKTEVRFSNEREAFSAVYYAVKSALDKGNDIRREIEFSENKLKLAQPANATVHMKATVFSPYKDTRGSNNVGEILPKKEAEKGGFFEIKASELRGFKSVAQAPEKEETELSFVTETVKANEKLSEVTEEAALEEKTPTAEVRDHHAAPTLFEAEGTKEVYKYIGEVFNTYMIVTKGDDMFLVDKHALHERAIYDKLRSNAQNYAQPFLTPVSVTLTKEEYQLILDYSDELNKTGIETEDFGGGTILVRSMPMHMKDSDAADALREIAGKLKDNPLALETERSDWIYHSVACRAAIKAGHRSSPEELIALLKSIDDINFCPHGRPVTVKLSRAKIEKEFGRTE